LQSALNVDKILLNIFLYFYMKKFLTFFILFSSCVSALMTGKPIFNIELGDPGYEYKSVKGINSYVLANTKQHSVGERTYSEYYNLQDYKAKQRFFRVHIPVKITPNFSNKPKTVDLAYSFSFESIYKKKEDNHTVTKKSTVNYPFKWEKIPVANGAVTEWILSSEWMVQSDKSIWDNCDVLVVNKAGKMKIAKQADEDDRWSIPLVDLYFPFPITYWLTQKGFNGQWKDESFPNFVYRDVKGNEILLNCNVQVFSSGDSDPSCGTLKLKDLRKLFDNLKKGWTNPYKDENIYTNLWKISSWAEKYGKIVEPKLKAAFLSRICMQFPNDSDAAELLLKQLAINKESEKAGRVYVKCKKKWPLWTEHWFKLYLASVQDKLTRRVLLIAYKREHPDSAFAYEKIAQSLIKDNRPRLAKRLLDTWCSIEPSNIYVYAAYADVAKLNDNEDEMKSSYSQAIRYAIPTKTNNFLIGDGYDFYIKGCNLLEADKIESALRYFRKTLTFTNSTACHLRMGDAYLKIGVIPSAIKSYKNALSLSPEHPGALSGIARAYNRVKNSTSQKPYQKKLEIVISPLVKKEILKKNWTNTISLSKYVLDVYPDSRIMMQAYVRSLIHLGLYGQASEMLYKISDSKRSDIRMNMLWAELITAVYNDKSVLILSDDKIDLLNLAVEVWKKISKSSPAFSAAYLEQAILNLQIGNYPHAYLAFKKCYKISPSPELAVWIADICLQMADKYQNRTLPDDSSKTYSAEAINFYNKANKSADNNFFSPEVCIGLYRSAKHESKSNADYNAYLRKALRVFPASPEVRAAQIKAYADADATAPALWVPYTNALENLRSSNYQVLSCLEKIYNSRKIPESKMLMKAALIELFWSEIIFNNINSKRELASNTKIYSIENRSGYRFVLKKHIFIQPGSAYEWFALRSKYSSADLKTGKTLWWQRHLLIVDAYRKLKEAFNSADNKTGEVAICYAAVKRDYGYSFMVDENNPSSAYNNELIRVFYLPVNSSPNLKSRRFYGYDARRLESMEIRVPPVHELISKILPPCKNSGSLALPPIVRQFYFSKNVTEKLLPVFLQDLLPALDKNEAFRKVEVNGFSMPKDNKFKIVWLEKSKRQRNSKCEFSEDGLTIHQQPEKDNDSSWKGASVTPLISNNEVPRSDSFFKNSFSGQIQGISIATANLNVGNPPALTLIFTPDIIYKPYKNWNDENLTLELTWNNLSNALLKTFVKSYRINDGLLYDNPGVKIGEKEIITPADLSIEINKSQINIFAKSAGVSNGFKKIITASHNLSNFAWRRGVYFSIQSKACPGPIEYKIKDFYFGEE